MKWKTASTAVAALLLIASRSEAPGCGPTFPEPIFTFASYPSGPGYAEEGRLGIVKPGFWRRFLVIAYRHMSDRPLTKGEIDSMAAPVPAMPDGREVWKKARKSVNPQMADVDVSDFRSNPKTFSSFLNCGNDAFRSAAATLQARASADPASAKQWLAAQDTVFSNCGEGRKIPPEAAGAAKADRDYQIAAAHFYSESYEEAHLRLRAIAASASPWRPIAPYLAARALIRGATIPFESRDKWDTAKLEQAAAELAAMQKDPASRAYHGAAARLQQWLALRLRPAQALARLTRELSAPGAPDFQASLTDYTFLMDNYKPAWAEGNDLGDMTRWIAAFQAGQSEQALSQWRAAKSLPWLVAAITVATAKEASVARELIAAARAVPASSPAYATVLHHRMRLQRETGEHDQVRSELDRLLPAIEKEQTRSALNVFLTHRLALARSTAEFVRFAPRRAVGVTWADEAGAEEDKAGQALLDQDGAAMLNRGMPFTLWMAALNDKALPAGIGARLLTAAFPRAVLLRDHVSAAALLRRLGSSVANAGDYLRAATPAERDFAAAYVMLKNPGFRLEAEAGLPIRQKAPHSELDTFAANWWCALDTEAAPLPAPFLNEVQKSAFEKEWKVLSAAPGAPAWLSRQAVAWAAANPGDPRSPEALHLAVRATRYGCGNGMGNYGAPSKAAFDLLHKRWPNSEWAKKTRYWFN